jgi:hypothetical protein
MIAGSSLPGQPQVLPAGAVGPGAGPRPAPGAHVMPGAPTPRPMVAPGGPEMSIQALGAPPPGPAEMAATSAPAATAAPPNPAMASAVASALGGGAPGGFNMDAVRGAVGDFRSQMDAWRDGGRQGARPDFRSMLAGIIPGFGGGGGGAPTAPAMPGFAAGAPAPGGPVPSLALQRGGMTPTPGGRGIPPIPGQAGRRF